jgi:DGQHR domain-containing protein
MAKVTIHKGKKTGTLAHALTVPCMPVEQSGYELFVFKMKASLAWKIFSISRKEPDANKGYQRFLSEARVSSVANYIDSKNPIPVSLLVAIDNGKFDGKKSTLTIPHGTDIGWIIDGQHRLAGAAEAAKKGHDIELIIVAFLALDDRHQIQQFVTINDEAKGVPRSLLLNLLKQIPDKTLQEQANERSIDLAKQLNSDPKSVFFQRIASLSAPKTGQISDVNFILLSRVPESGKIHIVQNGLIRAKELVLAEWQRTLFLRNESPETRGWLLDVMKCVESLGKRDFTLDEVYAFERQLGDLYPGNQNVKPKIRQQLQYLRDRGFIDFVSRGNYRLRS